jgi:hypothetical protein
MGEAQRLVEAVRANAEGTPYVVEETDDGFRVRLDVADARWWGSLWKSGITRVATQDVRVDDASKQIAITDTLRDLEWFGGVSLEDGMRPRLSGSAAVQTGRLNHRAFRKSWAFDEQGRFRKVVDYSFDSGEGRDLIRRAARSLGWRERMPISVKIALVAAVVGGAGAVVTVVVLLVAALLGLF